MSPAPLDDLGGPVLRAVSGTAGKRAADAVPTRRLTILNLHGIGRPPRALDPGEDGSWIGVGQFEEVLDAVEGRPEVRLTFDDGNASDLEIALPRLLHRGLTARFFVLAGRLGERGRLDRRGVLALAEAGMSVGSHGWAHRDWRAVSGPDAHREVTGALDALSGLLGRPVREVAVPFGSYDRPVLARLRAAGVATAYTSDGGRAREGSWLQRRTSLRSTVDRQRLAAVLDDDIPARLRARRLASGLVKRSRGGPR
jgi:peptidoglycan/xylan/chitin deacetylase (PgdA/CDA1 family)